MFFLNVLNHSSKAVNEWVNLFHWKHIAIKIRFPNKLVMFTFDMFASFSNERLENMLEYTERNQKGSKYIPKWDFEFLEKFLPGDVI